MSDTDTHSDTYREIGRRPTAEGEARTLLLRRHCAGSVPSAWAACTEPDRLSRWLHPVTGELSIGGAYRLEDEAHGEILRCEPPHLLAVTWSQGEGGPATEVVVRLAPLTERETAVELEHGPIPDEVEADGRFLDPVLNDAPTGMWGLGTRWDMVLISLDRYLRGELDEPSAATLDEHSPEVRELADRCGLAWASTVASATTNRA
ncbi:SRPBCC domain-containing protein [Streptomyces sp. ACA25]|uniref:SRPBCC domain-containing protein n=1 Tax=Streptomyces sp. ACA25 TaxID=3022596 RepID=UPI002307881D|nr:SRPBCC domain-containing protein [Streptomyces sp. ACA25]MDB1087802.1 SRPBCC domain-containing protein [Streptomyces sp. ACA25]